MQRCRHTRASGHRCTTPALDGHDLCVQHRKEPVDLPSPPRAASFLPVEFEVPCLTDHAGIQRGISELIGHLESPAVDPRRVGLLLYALQIAASILPPLPAEAGTPAPALRLNPPFARPLL